jgi:hypothetical protein
MFQTTPSLHLQCGGIPNLRSHLILYGLLQVSLLLRPCAQQQYHIDCLHLPGPLVTVAMLKDVTNTVY